MRLIFFKPGMPLPLHRHRPRQRGCFACRHRLLLAWRASGERGCTRALVCQAERMLPPSAKHARRLGPPAPHTRVSRWRGTTDGPAAAPAFPSSAPVNMGLGLAACVFGSSGMGKGLWWVVGLWLRPRHKDTPFVGYGSSNGSERLTHAHTQHAHTQTRT